MLSVIGPEARKLGITIEVADNLGYYINDDSRQELWQGCPGGKHSCAITSTGMVKGCLFLPDDMIEGDLRKRPLPDIWYDPQAFSYARASADDIGPNCDDCENAPQCNGGCSAMSFILTGRLHNDPYCFLGLERRG
jgi:radical SAM protein with 4Fe4S-binding SPASM domain